MASKTKATELRRANRNTKMGQKRKSKNRNQGTTKTKAALFGDKE
jgi:hypothetical protein